MNDMHFKCMRGTWNGESICLTFMAGTFMYKMVGYNFLSPSTDYVPGCSGLEMVGKDSFNFP